MMLFRFGNALYSRCYPLYYPLYSCWKIFADRRERRIVRNIVSPGDQVVDVGANIGVYSRFFSLLVGPTGSVTAIEPEASNFHRLVQNTAALSNVKVFCAAAGDHSGEALLFKSNDMNVDHRTFDSGDGRTSEMVKMIALDDVITSGQPISLIKIDVQGFELSVLKGANRILNENKNIKILMEFWPYGLLKASVEPDSVIDYLRSHGFFIADTTTPEREFISSELSSSSENSYCNLIAYRK
jgi:FkbM family methyltransferase